MKLFNLSSINSIVANDIHAHLAAQVFGSFNHEIKSLCGDFVILLHLTNGADHAQYDYTISLTTKCGKVLKSVKHENNNVTNIKECLRNSIIEWNTNNPQQPTNKQPIINDKPQDQKLSINKAFESFNLKRTTSKNLTVITNFGGREVCRIAGSHAERITTEGLIRDAIEEGRANDTQPCQAYQDFSALPVGAEFQQVFTGSAHNAIFDCTKVSDSDFTMTTTDEKLFTYDRGWSTSSVHTDLRINTRDFTAKALKEDLQETKQVNIEFINGDECITLHVEDMNNYFDCCIEHYIDGKIVNDICEDRFIANGYAPIVAKLKQFIIDLPNLSEKPNSSKFYVVTPQVDNRVLVKPLNHGDFTGLEQSFIHHALSDFSISENDDYCIVFNTSVYEVTTALDNHQPLRTSQEHIDNEKRNIANLKKTIANPAWNEGYIANCKKDLESRQRDLTFLEAYCVPLTTEDKKNRLLLWCSKLCDEQEFNTLRDLRQLLDFKGELNNIFFDMSNQHIRNQSADGDGFVLNLLYSSLSENKNNWTDELINELYSLVSATEEL